jgi:signal transduction histidine kinase
MFKSGRTRELEKNFNRLAKILDAVNLPIWQRDSQLDIVFCNDNYLKLAEVPANTDNIPELSKEVKKLAENVAREKKLLKRRVKIVSKGERTEYEVCEMPFESGTIGYARNIDELGKTEEELKRYQGVQQQLLETSASAIAIYGPDQKLKFFNNAFVNLWKLEESWLGTAPTYGEVLEVLREKRRLPEQADFRSFKQENLALFNRMMETREEFYFLPDARSLRVIIIPHALGGLQFIYEDMTDRLALEASYNTLIAVQKHTLANLHEGVAVFGESGKLTLSNAVYAKMLGLDEKYLESEPFFADILEKTKELYIYEGTWDQFKRQITTSMHNRESMTQMLEFSNGKVYSIQLIPLPDGELLATFNDITASTLVERSLRERTEALEDVDRLKTEFLQNISYELRSPLTSIIGFAEILRQQIFGELNKPQKTYLEDIYNASRQLETLINDILDISSIEAGYMKLSYDRFDIHAMLASVTALTKERISDHGLNMQFNCPPNIGKMNGDEKRIKQVVYNLLNNAIKFTPEGGTITLGAKNNGNNELMMWVEDTGRGIPAEDLPMVFQKFHRTRSKGGAGLGLSVAKNLVELHGGTIDIQSEVDKGTLVTCIFPKEHKNKLQQ